MHTRVNGVEAHLLGKHSRVGRKLVRRVIYILLHCGNCLLFKSKSMMTSSSSTMIRTYFIGRACRNSIPQAHSEARPAVLVVEDFSCWDRLARFNVHRRAERVALVGAGSGVVTWESGGGHWPTVPLWWLWTYCLVSLSTRFIYPSRSVQ
jgi:hypothetical protein